MWILSVLPDSFIHLILTLGLLGTIAGFVLGFIPFISKYLIPIRIISILIFSLGVYLEGGLANEQEWQLKVKEVEAQLARAEAEASRLNTELQNALTQRDNAIKQKGKNIIQYIDKFKDREILKEVPGPERVRIEKVIEYIEKCPVPKELLDIHNKAAVMNKSSGDKK